MRKVGLFILLLIIIGCEHKPQKPPLEGRWYYEYDKTQDGVSQYLELDFYHGHIVRLTPHCNYTADFWEEGEGTYTMHGDSIVFNLTLDIPPAWEWLPHVTRTLTRGKYVYTDIYTFVDVEMETTKDGEKTVQKMTFRKENPLLKD